MKARSRKNSKADIDPDRKNALLEFCGQVDLKFRDLSLLDQALTHRSYSNESGHSGANNERLEYLGDSVLGFIVNEYLYRRFPNMPEGQLSRIKSAAVSEKTLSGIARALRLGKVLRLSKGERNSGGNRRPSNLADSFEALMAGIYLDRGLGPARKFLIPLIEKKLDTLSRPGKAVDPKSSLQELVQKQSHAHPVYELVSLDGPDHKREFVCKVSVEGKEIARGSGSSRKRAEQQAAQRALELLR